METKAYGIISPEDKERDEMIKGLIDAIYSKDYARADKVFEKIKSLGDHKLIMDAEYFMEITKKVWRMKKLVVILLALLCCSCSLQITIGKIPGADPKPETVEESKVETYVGGDRFYRIPPKKIKL